jgi:Sugar-tranasporters, 12 TM
MTAALARCSTLRLHTRAATMAAAVRTILSGRRLRAIGLFQIAYEGAFLTWLFAYVPAITYTATGEALSQGVVFSALTLAFMAGSTLLTLLHAARPRLSDEVVLAAAALASAVAYGASCGALPVAALLAQFLVLEVCAGESCAGERQRYLLKETNTSTCMTRPY